MKFSYNWLRELVDGLDTPPEELERLITLKTAECEGVERHGDDYVIDVDNKSLTHRPDLWGHHGMAREVAAIVGRRSIDPVAGGQWPPDGAAAPVRVTIQDYALCPRYSALVFENVAVRPSPQWMQRRLEAVGLNPINNVVDVTNYVMAEIAQPMHAFDAAKLHGHEIIVRPAREEEAIQALNGELYRLDASNLVIADPEGAVAIAGVIGGAGSAISETTTRIVLESANFNAASIRKTSARIRLRTDASIRFEKAQDPVNTVRGLRRACALLEQVSPGVRLVGGLADAYQPPPPQPPISLPLDWLARKLGREVPGEEVRRILEALEFGVEEVDEHALFVFVPSWRATKDISIREDLVEEVGRMVGYSEFPPRPPLVEAHVPPASPQREFHNRVREMAAAQGFTEVYNYSFVSGEMARAFGFDPAALVQVANPIASDQDLLRPSLLPGVWKNINDNARHFDAFRLFEIGREIHADREAPHFAAAIFAKDDGVAGLLELKRLAECLLPGAEARPAAARSFEHPQRAAEVCGGVTVIGRLFEFHPRMVEHGRAAVLDLDLTLLEKLQPGVRRYQPLRRYPSSAFDVSVAAPARAWIADVQSKLAALAGEALLQIEFLREFPLPGGQRSLSYRLTVGSNERTLSAAEVGAIRARVLEGMQAAGYTLRS
jgi:phenylalanyl-tRNA synthetase beta chain